MRITIFNGSVNAERGTTQIVSEEFAAGARAAGAEVETVFVAKKNIKPCAACRSCWIKTPGVCAIKDDMADLLSKFIGSDIVVFATPVYVDNVTSIMKQFIDRLVPLIDPRMDKTEDGEITHRKRFDRYPEFAIISTCGFPGQEQFQIISAYFKRFAHHMYTRVAGEIYRDTAMLLRLGDKPPLDSIIAAYKAALSAAGREIVATRSISEQTALQISAPLAPREFYVSEANKYWDSQIKSD
ncbi:MAG: flavodoxin family protein [bacterium]